MNDFFDLKTCIDLCLYIFPLFIIIFFFAIKSSPNVNLQLKRDIELQKPVTHTSIRLGKRKSDQNKVCDSSKGQRLSDQGEISKDILTMRCNYVKTIKKI